MEDAIVGGWNQGGVVLPTMEMLIIVSDGTVVCLVAGYRPFQLPLFGKAHRKTRGKIIHILIQETGSSGLPKLNLGTERESMFPPKHPPAWKSRFVAL